MGSLTPSGSGTDALWNGILTRQSAIRAVDLPSMEFRCRWVAPVDRSILAAALPEDYRPGGDPAGEMLTVAADQALHQAGWQNDDLWGQDVAVLIGTGAGPTQSLHDAYAEFSKSNGRRMRPTTVPRCMANSLSAQLAIRYRLSGANYVVVSACASATVAIGTAHRMIRCGLADRVLCGGVETILDPVSRSAWDRLGVLTRNPTADGAVRPFDRRRDGFVLGEGAGALVLESMATAHRRNARIIGEIAGYGDASDATHMTQPNCNGQVRAMTRALEDAALAPADIDLIVAHGTATVANDRTEAQALHQLFGDAVAEVPVLALKPLWGHTLGASGAIESIAALQALDSERIPPDPLITREPDPACALRFAPSVAVHASLDYVMKNCFAFGGNNAVLILRRAGRPPTPCQGDS